MGSPMHIVILVVHVLGQCLGFPLFSVFDHNEQKNALESAIVEFTTIHSNSKGNRNIAFAEALDATQKEITGTKTRQGSNSGEVSGEVQHFEIQNISFTETQGIFSNISAEGNGSQILDTSTPSIQDLNTGGFVNVSSQTSRMDEGKHTIFTYGSIRDTTTEPNLNQAPKSWFIGEKDRDRFMNYFMGGNEDDLRNEEKEEGEAEDVVKKAAAEGKEKGEVVFENRKKGEEEGSAKKGKEENEGMDHNYDQKESNRHGGVAGSFAGHAGFGRVRATDFSLEDEPIERSQKGLSENSNKTEVKKQSRNPPTLKYGRNKIIYSTQSKVSLNILPKL